MSYQEKKTIASLVSEILLMSVYLMYSISQYQEMGVSLLNNLEFWARTMLVFLGVGIVITIVIQILFHIIIAISQEVKKEISKAKETKKDAAKSGKEENYQEDFDEIAEIEDEMDKLISLKAMRNSYIIVGIGFVSALISLYFKMPVGIMLNIIFISFLAGSIIEGFSQLYFYRRGVRFG